MIADSVTLRGSSMESDPEPLFSHRRHPAHHLILGLCPATGPTTAVRGVPPVWTSPKLRYRPYLAGGTLPEARRRLRLANHRSQARRLRRSAAGARDAPRATVRAARCHPLAAALMMCSDRDPERVPRQLLRPVAEQLGYPRAQARCTAVRQHTAVDLMPLRATARAAYVHRIQTAGAPNLSAEPPRSATRPHGCAPARTARGTPPPPGSPVPAPALPSGSPLPVNSSAAPPLPVEFPGFSPHPFSRLPDVP